MASDTCWTRHTCAVCKKWVWCDTIKAACPWRTGDGEEMCKDCIMQYADEMKKFVDVEES